MIPVLAAVQLKMSEENGARMRAESRVVEVEKQCSMLEFDLKQSVQKMEQLMKQKERLEDEASCRWSKFYLPTLVFFVVGSVLILSFLKSLLLLR